MTKIETFKSLKLTKYIENMATNWFDYFIERMKQKGIVDLDISIEGELPKGVPIIEATEVNSENILCTREASKKIKKPNEHILIYCNQLFLGNPKTKYTKGAETAYSLGFELSTQRRHAECFFDILGNTAYARIMDEIDKTSKAHKSLGGLAQILAWGVEGKFLEENPQFDESFPLDPKETIDDLVETYSKIANNMTKDFN